MELVTLEGVGKKYTLALRSGGGVLSRGFGSAQFFWALRGITLTVPEGQILGIVGRNGAGKTTLLYIIAGLLEPTEGTVSCKGRVASLFNLGIGFKDELSGRENIAINATLLGFSRDMIQARTNDIIRFAELGEFIDMPLGHYSQGMRLRLGFSIAAHLDFDVFVIDEVLLVGDGGFQQKCIEKLMSLKKQGKTMIISSQMLDYVERLTDRVILLERGKIEADGPAPVVIDRYRKLLNEHRSLGLSVDRQMVCHTKWWVHPTEEWNRREGTKDIAFDKVELVNAWGFAVKQCRPGAALSVKMTCTATRPVERPHFGVALFRDDGVYVYGVNTRDDDITIDGIGAGTGEVTFKYARLPLMPGLYHLSVCIWDERELVPYDYLRGQLSVTVAGDNPLRQVCCVLPTNDKGCHALSSGASVLPVTDIPIVDVKETTMSGGMRIRLGDSSGIEKRSFMTGTTLRIDMLLEAPVADAMMWIGLFRSDGVLCHVVTCPLKADRCSATVICEQLMLLPGRYVLQAALHDRRTGNFVNGIQGLVVFDMFFSRGDHGTMYLEHVWDLRLPTMKRCVG